MPSPADREAPQRLFFALWPDDQVRRSLDRAAEDVAQRIRGKRVPTGKLHITLAFLGDVTRDTRACLESWADNLYGMPFRLVLDRNGFWPRPRVVWLGAADVPRALSELVDGLNRGVKDCGLRSETRPFQAHLTIMRKVQIKPILNDFDPIEWEVADFALVASDMRPEGAVYTVLRRWPLTG